MFVPGFEMSDPAPSLPIVQLVSMAARTTVTMKWIDLLMVFSP